MVFIAWKDMRRKEKLGQLRELVDGRWDACSSQRMGVDGSRMTMMVVGMLAVAEERVKGSVGASLFPTNKREHWDIFISGRECLKNISFAHPHWRTPSNGLGLWCS
ncbi:unnamed protein product [Prunus armeniaca]